MLQDEEIKIGDDKIPPPYSQQTTETKQMGMAQEEDVKGNKYTPLGDLGTSNGGFAVDEHSYETFKF